MVPIFLLIEKLTKISKLKTSKKAFTLVEIMISVAIIGILTVIAIASVGLISQRGRDTRRIDDMKAWQNAQEIYFTQDEEYYLAAVNGDCTDFDTNIMSGGVVDPKRDSAVFVYSCLASGDQEHYCASARFEGDKNVNCGGCSCDATTCTVSALVDDPYFCVSNLQ